MATGEETEIATASGASGATAPAEDADSGATTAPSDSSSTFGISQESYESLVESGQAVALCEDPPVDPPVPECPPCIEDPEAIVPDWRYKEEGDVFLNGKTCEYCVTVDSGETDATILNDIASREAFLEEQKIKGVDLILEYFGKVPLDSASMAVVLDQAIPKQYDVPVRPLLQIRVLVCVPVATIDSIQIISDGEEEDEEIPIAPIGCVLEAQKVRVMVKRVAEAFRYYGNRYSLWSHQTGQVIPNFNPDDERKKLKLFVPALVQLMNRNGFKLNGRKLNLDLMKTMRLFTHRLTNRNANR